MRDFVNIGIASIPSRSVGLRDAVQVLRRQCDTLHVYLDGYGETPAFLFDEHIRVYHSRDHSRLGAAGKFSGAEHSRGYFFTVDDDIVYPADYVRRMTQRLDSHQRKAIVGVHASILMQPVTDYYRDRRTRSFWLPLDRETPVHILGTGTTAFHLEYFRPRLSWFPERDMADLYIAIAAQQRRIPMVAIARNLRWLEPHPSVDQTESIYARERLSPKRQTDLANSIVWRLPPEHVS